MSFWSKYTFQHTMRSRFFSLLCTCCVFNSRSLPFSFFLLRKFNPFQWLVRPKPCTTPGASRVSERCSPLPCHSNSLAGPSIESRSLTCRGQLNLKVHIMCHLRAFAGTFVKFCFLFFRLGVCLSCGRIGCDLPSSH